MRSNATDRLIVDAVNERHRLEVRLDDIEVEKELLAEEEMRVRAQIAELSNHSLSLKLGVGHARIKRALRIV